MLMFEITANAFELAAMAVVSALIGFAFRTIQIMKSKSRILMLEQEIRTNHAEILDLQRDFVALELKMNLIKDTGVVKMNGGLKADNNEKLPDVYLRKKLLNKEPPPEKSETLSVVYNNYFGKEA